MIPHDFIKKWQGTKLKERAAAQEHFIDLCRLLGEPTPAETDPTGLDYGFEVGATKTTGGRGFADVFKRGCFGWEYKGTHANLDTAFAQIQRYAVALDNPPLLIVSDIGTTIRIHTNWTNSVSKTYEIPIAALEDADQRDLLKLAFTDPEALRPAKSRQELTEEVAGEFAALATSLREKGHAPEQVAHFINRLVFCMFAEDVDLLPSKLFTRMIERGLDDPSEFETFARSLFLAMKSGGLVGFERVAWFNGGLFNDDLAFSLTKDELKIVHRAAVQYWGDIDPSILGTLFERGLDPEKRSQLGAHYTDREKIMMIVGPTIIEPLAAEWSATRSVIEGLMKKAELADAAAKTTRGRSGSRKQGAATTAINAAQAALDAFLKRLSNFRVLDPACGSGNFLYVALRELKDLEHRAQVEAEALGLPRGFPQIGPEVVRGIEINPYAAELARVSVWIGEIQWMLKNGFAASSNPILKPLETIECRDALLSLSQDGEWSPAEWPEANAIIGNPPFLGSKFLRNGKPATRNRPAVAGLGDEYVDRLFRVFEGKNPGSADFVSYWFALALRATSSTPKPIIGFVATKSIAKGATNKALDALVSEGEMELFWAVANTEWVVAGAEVRVSLVCLRPRMTGLGASLPLLNFRPVSAVNTDLTHGLTLARAHTMPSNKRRCFQGVKQNGTFETPATKARSLLLEPRNPNGLDNSLVVKRFYGNDDVSGRDQDGWIIDFTEYPKEEDAALFEKPFKAVEHVRTERSNRTKGKATESDKLKSHWLMQRPRPDLRSEIANLSRVIGVPETSEHFIFRFLPATGIYSGSLFIFPREDFTFFGICQSTTHVLWARLAGNNLGSGNQDRYNKGWTFETFPFPEGLTPDIPASSYAEDPRATAIATAANRLNELRENWLNPPDLVRREPEVVEGFPERILPVDDKAAEILKKRTLTNLYNQRPAWLDHAHKALDGAVASAYGWPADLSDDEILARLFALNQERTESQ
ncbi:class I SAM-dependent DNA methyltransferase [Martelella mediterranea]|uniref:site-specific DNA-methyltransferase (adenine-specific) n=1 Tax=Martelella mediterranea TaxID=293089 RepID=A0A4R3NWT1_9HYPH|nr:DNA methyltransferase [Martelella mediterranea]TCT42798.1 type II restriction/modification system DNA methylase subunit YeeA [Martelella mediterranea]